MVRRHTRSFDLLSTYDNYWPDVRGIFILLGLLLAGALVGEFVIYILGLVFNTEFVTSYGILISYPIQFIPAMMYASAKSRSKFFDQTGIPVDEGRFRPIGAGWMALMVIISTIAASLVFEPVCMLLPEMPERIRNLMEMLTNGPLWAIVLSTCIFAPFFEEWLCRGMVLRGMLQKVKPVWAIIISAAFFAIIHMNPWQALPAFILGCLFGYVYYKTGSLKFTMLMHCANNAFSVFLSRIPGCEDCDYVYEIIGDKLTYGILYAASLALLCLFIARMYKTEFTK